MLQVNHQHNPPPPPNHIQSIKNKPPYVYARAGVWETLRQLPIDRVLDDYSQESLKSVVRLSSSSALLFDPSYSSVNMSSQLKCDQATVATPSHSFSVLVSIFLLLLMTHAHKNTTTHLRARTHTHTHTQKHTRRNTRTQPHITYT